VGAVAILGMDEFKGKMPFFAGIDGVRFKRQVKPGDTLRLEVELGKMRRGVGMGNATATVDGELAVRGELMFAVADISAAS
ncbi:MAG: 3-hydroxyacyl-[acyl-carrier-protein] dehydratase FabZ, partial [Thermomicrobiales bacterium]